MHKSKHVSSYWVWFIITWTWKGNPYVSKFLILTVLFSTGYVTLNCNAIWATIHVLLLILSRTTQISDCGGAGVVGGGTVVVEFGDGVGGVVGLGVVVVVGAGVDVVVFGAAVVVVVVSGVVVLVVVEFCVVVSGATVVVFFVVGVGSVVGFVVVSGATVVLSLFKFTFPAVTVSSPENENYFKT